MLGVKRQELSEVERKLVAKGARITRQRLIVLDTLSANRGHVTADKLLELAQARDPNINKTTIYRTLELFSQLGLVAINNISQGANGSQYEYELVSTPHHHLICKECGKAIELSDAVLNPLRQLIESEHRFKPCFDQITFLGICSDCLPATDVTYST